MTEHKYTDEEVIKALELCFTPKGTTYTCAKCPYRKFGALCKVERDRAAIDLLHRQKAEIERLNILVNEAKTKRAKKFVPQEYVQLTIDEMESEA